ncbi:MAG: D-alanyl-D-alanine carboxypeptidase family protein [Firmicutes bacterium]|nr:D-alanyl-D-alanine carboxypeptidase family protein [Bacillota bacterium]
MLLLCCISIAVICFSFLWSGINGSGASGSIAWGEYSKRGVSADRTGKENSAFSQVVHEGRVKLDALVAEREKIAMNEAESDKLDLGKYLIVVNEDYPIVQEFIAETYTIVDVLNDRGQQKKLEERTLHYYMELKKYLEEQEGIIVDLDSGYRTYQDQQDLIEEMTAAFGAAYANRYAAPPGMSEHNTGLAVDICIVVDGVLIDENEAMTAQTEIFGRIHEVMTDFGFVLDYPYECWHTRFVGSPEIARAFSESGMSFENFAKKYIEEHSNGSI